jgi:hypothetical protein
MGQLAEHACAVTWWAEKIPDSCIVWGLKVLQWGRIAKVVGFVGGLVILVDIFGEKTIRSAAEWSRDLLQRGIDFLDVFRTWARKKLETIFALLGLILGARYITHWLFPSADYWVSHYTSWVDVDVNVIAFIVGIPSLLILSLLLIQLPSLWLARRPVARTFRLVALAMLIISFAMDMAVN